MDNNNNQMNFLIQNAEFRLQYLYEDIDGMYLGREDSLDIYIYICWKKKFGPCLKRDK